MCDSTEEAMTSLASNLRALRAARKMSQRQLARIAKVSQERIIRAERGGHEVSLQFLFAVCKALDYPAWRIIRRVDTTIACVDPTSPDLEV